MVFANPEDNLRIVRAVRKALGPLLKTRGIDLKFCTFEEFEREAVSQKTDLVLGTSGHIRRLAHHNIQPIATIVAHPGADPNRAEGTAVVVRSDRFELQTLGDLRSRIIAANNPLGFSGWQIVLGEIAKFGVEEPRSFFGKVIFTGDSRSTDRIAELVIDGEADAGFLRLCAYEAFLKRHPEKIGLLRVLDRRESSLACAHSTDLFPGFTLAVTEHIAPELARRLALALFSMEPDEGGPKWAVPANFLTKPVRAEKLLTAVDKALSRKGSAEVQTTDAREAREAFAALSDREREVALLAVQKLTNRQIAERLELAVRTVEFHRAGAMRKLGTHSAKELTEKLIAAGALGS